MKNLINKKITIGEIYNIFQKYGDLNINVKTPYGFSKIENCALTAKDSNVLLIKTKDFHLQCSPNHRIKKHNNKFIFAKNLNVGDSIQTINGNQTINAIILLPEKKDLYDIQVKKYKQYYSNGIVSHNSSIADSLMFCLFDKCSRTSKALHVLNQNKNEFICTLKFEMNGLIYYIQRQGFRRPNGNVRVLVKFWYEDELGIEHILSGGERDDTNKIIRNYVGTYEDFVLTCMSLQTESDEFILSSQRNRKDIIARLFNIDIFEKLSKIANIHAKEINSNIKFLQKDIDDGLISKLNVQIETDTLELSELKRRKDIITTEIDGFNSNIFELNKSIRHIDDSENPELLLRNIEQYKNEVSNITNKRLKIESSINDITNTLNKYNNLFLTVSEDEVTTNYNSYQSLLKRSQDVKNEIKNITRELKSINDKLKKLETYEYDPNCEYCVKNPFVIDAIHSKDTVITLTDKLNKKQTYSNEITIDINKLVDVEQQFKFINELKQKIKVYQNKLETESLQLQNVTNEIKNIELKIQVSTDKYNLCIQNEQFVLENAKLESKISELKTHIDDSTSSLKRIDSRIIKLTSEINVSTTNKKQIQDKLIELKKLSVSQKAYDLYLDAIKRDGVPYYLIDRIIPELQSNVNNILQQLTDYTILFNMDKESKNIDIYIVYDTDRYWPIELTSGMERFISSLALRVALNFISILPRPNFMIIDERFYVLDSDNMNSLSGLFDYLKSQFDFIICISHLESMRDMVDSIIDIKKENGFSSINYGGI